MTELKPVTSRTPTRGVPRLRAATLHKLENVLGRKLGAEYYAATCADLGLSNIDTPNDALRFADVLIAQGGLLTSVGRAVRAQAIMCGATDSIH